MEKLFDAKVRNVGTSLGVLIPREVAKEMKIERNETVKIAILRKDARTISKFLGSAKGAKPFERDHTERRF